MTLCWNNPNATARDYFEPLDNAKEHAADMAAMEADVDPLTLAAVQQAFDTGRPVHYVNSLGQRACACPPVKVTK